MLISTHLHLQSKYMRIFIICLITLLLQVKAKEIVLLGQPSELERSWIGMTQQLFDYIEYQKLIGGAQFYCRTMLRANLSSNKISKVYPLHTTLKIPRQTNQGELLVEENANDQKTKLVKRVDKALDYLSGFCTYYHSNAFIYEYCHKQHMRQFDSQLTKLIMQKPFYEDISMGIYNPQKRKAHSQHGTTSKQQPDQLPQYSDFTKQYSILTSGYVNKEGMLYFQQSQNQNLMYLSYHILEDKNDVILEQPFFLKFLCKNDEKSQQFTNYGLLVDPYIALYTAKNGQCDVLLDCKVPNVGAEFMGPQGSEELRVYGRYIFGKIEQKCTFPKIWNSQQGIKDNFEYEGRLTKLTYALDTKQQQQIFVVIGEIITSEFFQFEEEIGTSIRYHQYGSEAEGSPHLKNITEITSCQILFSKPILQKQPKQIRIIGNRLIQSENKFQVGQSYGCVGSYETDDYKLLQQNQLQLLIVEKLWGNTYKVIPSKNPSYNWLLIQFIQNFKCYHLKQDNLLIKNNHQQQSLNNFFLNFYRITPQNSIFSFPIKAQSFLYIINIKQIGLLKLITKNKQNSTFKYLISSNKIIKMKEESEIDLQLTQQNHYYQNDTESTGVIFSNFIYIRIGRLSNGLNVGGIWKMYDKVKFPRMILLDQTLISLERIHGHADIRSIHFDKIRNEDLFATDVWLKSLQQHFVPQSNTENKLFLQESYSLSYLYVDGDYCLDPISKNRFTNVTLKCGPSYFQIKQVSQPKPCEYSIQIETSLLCKDGQIFTVPKEEDLSTNLDIKAQLSAGVVCFPNQNILTTKEELAQWIYSIQYNEQSQVQDD